MAQSSTRSFGATAARSYAISCGGLQTPLSAYSQYRSGISRPREGRKTIPAQP